MDEQELKERERKLGIDQKPKQKSVLDNKLIIASVLIIGFCWLLTYSNLAIFIFKTPLAELPAFQQNMFKISLILTFIFLTALILISFYKDKLFDITQKENNAIILVDSHTQFPVIQTIAKISHGLQLGHCTRCTPLMPYTEAGSSPTSRFFEFQNLRNGQVVGYSLWRQDYLRKITTHLMYRDFYGRNKTNKFWHGEQRQEQFRSVSDTAASKKAKELSHIKSQEDYAEESATGEE